MMLIGRLMIPTGSRENPQTTASRHNARHTHLPINMIHFVRYTSIYGLNNSADITGSPVWTSRDINGYVDGTTIRWHMPPNANHSSAIGGMTDLILVAVTQYSCAVEPALIVQVAKRASEVIGGYPEHSPARISNWTLAAMAVAILGVFWLGYWVGVHNVHNI